MLDKRVRVVWICSFSNSKTRKKLPIKISPFIKVLNWITGEPSKHGSDTAIWNTNALDEFETIDGVDLHVICPVRWLAPKVVRYTEKNIHYYFFREENSSFIRYVVHHLFTKYSSRYRINRKQIRSFIKEINPDIVHIMGAENPYYALSILDIPSDIPTIIQLQALLIRLVEITQDKGKRRSYYYKGLLEREIINKATYIGTKVDVFRDYIRSKIKPDARFLDLTLAMAQKINIESEGKEYDFVYFSSDIQKAGREAIESFIIAQRSLPNITLDVIGGFNLSFKEELDKRIETCKVKPNIIFEGRLATHDDVIRQIRRSHFALIPLKLDIVPNTIHEAMANGIPVVTTITEGTPNLNIKRKSVLLSKQGDYQAMADNMIALVQDKNLAEELRINAAKTEAEFSSNRSIVLKWLDAYKEYGRNIITGKQ